MKDRTFAEFREALKSEDLRRELSAFLAKKNAETAEDRILATVEFAAGKGYAVTAEELSLDEVARRELDPQEAEQAAGGTWCWSDYSCIAVSHYDNCSTIMNQSCGDNAIEANRICGDTAYKLYDSCGVSFYRQGYSCGGALGRW